MELASRQQLGEVLDRTGTGDAVLDETTKRFEQLDASPGWMQRFGRLLLGLLALLALLWPMARPLMIYLENHRSMNSLASYVYGDSPSLRKMHREALVHGLSREQALLVAGDPEIRSVVDRAESLWRDHYPEDPAVFYEYLRTHLDANRGLPEGALETAESLDPDNGFVALMEAGTILKQVVKRGRRRDPADYRSLRDWEIKDGEKLERGFAIVHEAAAMPICSGRRSELNARRTAGFEPAQDVATYAARLAWTMRQRMPEIMHLQYVSDAIAAEAARLEGTDEREGLRQLAEDWLSLIPKIGRGEESLVEVWFLQIGIQKAGGQLLESCRLLGLEEQARRLERPVVENRRWFDERRRKWETEALEEEGAMIRNHGSVLARMGIPMLIGTAGGEVVVDPADFEPGRVADYCGLELAAIFSAGIVLLLVAGLIALLLGRWGKMAGQLGTRVGRLPNATDWLWIVVLGVIVPLAWHALVTRVLPLRARDMSLYSTVLILPASQVGASFLLILVATVQTVRWRVAGRTRMLGLVGKRRLVWLPPVAAALALPAACWPAFVDWDLWDFEEQLWFYAPSWGLSGVALLWLLGLIGGALLGRPEHALSRATVGFAMVPAFIAGALVLALLSPVVSRELGHWLGRDKVTGISAEFGGATKYEYEVAECLRRRMLEWFEGG